MFLFFIFFLYKSSLDIYFSDALLFQLQNSSELKCIIERLGGSVLEGIEDIFSATHFLYATISRSEKILTCIAGRKWVLHPNYIIESQKAGRFIDVCFFDV